LPSNKHTSKQTNRIGTNKTTTSGATQNRTAALVCFRFAEAAGLLCISAVHVPDEQRRLKHHHCDAQVAPNDQSIRASACRRKRLSSQLDAHVLQVAVVDLGGDALIRAGASLGSPQPHLHQDLAHRGHICLQHSALGRLCFGIVGLLHPSDALTLTLTVHRVALHCIAARQLCDSWRCGQVSVFVDSFGKIAGLIALLDDSGFLSVQVVCVCVWVRV
jgi:hypothetical protein